MKQQEITTVLVQQIPQLLSKQISIQRVSGLTNITYAVIVNGMPSLIFKEYSKGDSHAFQHKIRTNVSREGLGSLCLFFNDNYMIEQYIKESCHPSQSQIVSMPLIEVIFSKMHKFHQLNIPLQNQQEEQNLCDYLLTEAMQNEILMLKNKNSNDQNFHILFQKIFSVISNKNQYKAMLLPKSKKSVAVCHNDLNNLNILVNPNDVYLIDYDYAAHNYIGYDIANLINETSFDYSKKQYPGFDVIKTYTAEQIYQFTNFYPCQNLSQLKNQVLRFMCISNLYWAVWSLKRVQLNVSKTFGILEHGLKRMELFEHYKNIVLTQSTDNH